MQSPVYAESYFYLTSMNSKYDVLQRHIVNVTVTMTTNSTNTY